MSLYDETKIKRFKIIEPFLKKEKKLKDIENESGVSYATLKRWIKSYKEKGMFGLEKKSREDKDSFKSIDEEGIKLIKKFCSNENDANITNLYKNCQNFLKEKNYDISYPTFYRILNNIDGFFKKSMNYHMSKIKKSNEVYTVVELPLSIIVQAHKAVVPTILILFDMAELKIIHYMINIEPTNIYSILGFIRESILKNSYLNNKLIKPKEIFIDSENVVTKAIAKGIFDELGIKISNHSLEDENITKFINGLNSDLNKVFYDKEKLFEKDEIVNFLDEYIYLENTDYNIKFECELLENKEFLREFDVLLQSTTRKVFSSSVRLKNIIFTSEILKKFEGLQIQLKFNPINYDIVYIFIKNKFYGLIQI